MFKKSSKKKGAIRKRKLSEDEEQKEDEVDQEEMEKLKLAKLKRELLTKKAGVSSVALAKGKKISKKAELTDDPFKLKSGGGLSYLKDRNRDRLGDGDERDVTNISDTFKVEKKIRDEEEEMNKYIENELLKRRGIESAAEKSNTFEVKKLSEILDPKSLYELPENMKVKYMAKSKIHREDGLLSAQMLNGIPEVDLGINTKLSNIERTEAAKRIMVDKFIKKEIENANDHTEQNALKTEQSVVRGGQLFTDQFYSQHMRFHKDDEPDSDSKDRFRTRIGEWKTSDKKGVYGESKAVGGIHGDDISQTATGRTEEDLYKRFAESQGANKVVDTTGHRI